MGKFIKISEEMVQGRYTSYAKICVEINVSSALPKAIKSKFRDEIWLQSIDYEKISFRCKRCHEHGHLI